MHWNCPNCGTTLKATPPKKKRMQLDQIRQIGITVASISAIICGILLYQSARSSRADKNLISASSKTAQIQSISASPSIDLVPRTPSVVTPQRDILIQSAAAPVHPRRGYTVRVRGPSNLREGPGLSYPISEIAKPGIRYLLVDWEGNWFKVAPESDPLATAWIRNDVAVLTEPDHNAKQ